jgi:hypothetical protein
MVLNGYRTYDTFVGSYLQIDPLIDSTWSTYVYVESNPVGKSDPTGDSLVRTVAFDWDDPLSLNDCFSDTGWGIEVSTSCVNIEIMPPTPDCWPLCGEGVPDPYPTTFPGDTHTEANGCFPTPRFDEALCGVCLHSGALRSGGESGPFMDCYRRHVCRDGDVEFLNEFKNVIYAGPDYNYVCETSCGYRPHVVNLSITTVKGQ